jgi:tetratricopeptide (TPR) repeat protein
MSTIESLAAGTDDERLKRLLSYIAADPANLNLRMDAAEQALNVGRPEIACQLLAGAPEKLGNRELNLFGVAQMQLKDFAEASRIFATILASGTEDPTVRFNLAWSLAMEKQFEEALELLTSEVTATLPQAAMLEVQLLHELGQFDGAADAARRHIAAFPDHEGLAAAVSVLALEFEDVDLARSCASKAANHPDAMTTLGTLALGESELSQAEELFERALNANDRLPRAWIGLGLTRLVEKDGRAAADIDRGAELFGDHIGSWIAAGWAHLIAGDLGLARQRFERALGIDENFGESHGSLAVIDALEGDEAEAKKRIAIAKRLDRQSFSAAFAQVLLTARAGKAETARALFEKILEAPVNERGDTAAAALVRMGLR